MKKTEKKSADTPPQTFRTKAARKEQERKRKEEQQYWIAANWNEGERWKWWSDHGSKSASAWSNIDNEGSSSTPAAVPEPPPPPPSVRSARPDDSKSETEKQRFPADALRPHWIPQPPAPSTPADGDNKQAVSPTQSDKSTRSDKDKAQRRKLKACFELAQTAHNTLFEEMVNYDLESSDDDNKKKTNM